MYAPAPPPRLFTFGFERSGTTLLSMLLGAHPSLAVPFSPVGLWYRYGRRLSEFGALDDRDNRLRLIRAILEEERIRYWPFEVTAEEIEGRLAQPDYPGIVEAFHAVYAERSGKPLWVLHDIANLYEMATANHWFPEARFIHLVRHPADVALSHKSYRYGSSNVCETAMRWREDVGANLAAGAMLGDERYLVIRYEDLVSDTPATLERCCAMAGVAYDERMLDYAADVGHKVPEHKRGLWPSLGTPVSTRAVGGAAKGLRRTERLAVEEIAEEPMRRLGYDAELARKKSVSKELFLLRSVLLRGGRGRRLRQRLGLATRGASA